MRLRYVPIWIMALMFPLWILPGAVSTQSQELPFKIQVETQLVIEIVTVKDKDGRPVDGLTEKDFIVLEDNIPQTISVFRHEELQDSQVLESKPAVTRSDPMQSNRQAHQLPGVSRFHGRRLLVLFFDMTNTSAPDQFRACAAADDFIRSQMSQSDMIAIMAFHLGAVSMLQDFTDDRNALLTTLSNLMYPDEGNTHDLGGTDSAEFDLFNTDRQLSALQTAVHMLGSVQERKSLVYFTGGLRLNSVDNQAQLRATINAAIRANVAFFPVDSRGLVATAPMGNASIASPGGIAMFSGAATMSLLTGFRGSQETLYSLAADTGGTALLDSNDLSAGILNAQRAITRYYLIGYYPTNIAGDGKFRRIKISLKSENAQIEYRQGYFAAKTFDKFNAADKERQLEEALMMDDPITDLTIAMEINYFQLNRAEYFVPIAVKIPGRELVLARKGGAGHTTIDFIGMIRDEYGTKISALRDKVDIKLGGTATSALATRPIQYDTGFTLFPGKYSIKFLARDAETGRIGTYQASFTVPNLMKEVKRIPISSVVLSSQLVDIKESIFDVGKDKYSIHAQSFNPLISAGRKLIPSVTRVFSKGRNLYVFLQAYEHYATESEPLVAYVTFYRGMTKAFETTPLNVTEESSLKSKTLNLKFGLSLSSLLSGEYVCQVTVLDLTSRKVAFWQAPVMLIP